MAFEYYSFPDLFADKKQDLVQAFRNLAMAIGNLCDPHDWRFLKGKLFVRTILKVMGDDCIEESRLGYDIAWCDEEISSKVTKANIFSRYGARGKTQPQDIILANKLCSARESITEHKFNYLIAAHLPSEDDRRLVIGLTDYENATANQYKTKGDQIKTKVYDWIDTVEIYMPDTPMYSQEVLDKFNADVTEYALNWIDNYHAHAIVEAK